MLGRRQARGSGAGTCRRSAERGQVLILWILAATVIFVIGAIVIDVGLWLTERRKAQMAADFSALAAASELPDGDPVTRALDFAERNGMKHGTDGVQVDVNTPYNGDSSMVEVTIKQGSPMLFTGIFGVGAFDIGARAVGALGSGELGPLDVVMILDRTTSMTDDDLDNAREGARAALQAFDPTLQHVGLGVIAASDPNNDSACWNAPSGEWVPVGGDGWLSDDYKDVNGDLDDGSRLVHALTDPCPRKKTGTNLGDPVKRAAEVLMQAENQNPRGARKAIILLTDGSAQNPGPNPCDYANQQATAAKNAGIEIFTIGFGIRSSDECNDAYSGYAAELLADMATNSDADPGGNCDAGAENSDGDHYFCEAKGESLDRVFSRLAENLSEGYRLFE